jgi:hypothetical protein
MDLRRSSRLKDTGPSKFVEYDPEDGADEEEYVEPRKTRKKPRQDKLDTEGQENKPRKRRGRRGILQEVADAPLDILFEVR